MNSQRFIDELSHKENLASQTQMTPQTMNQLREYGVTDSSELKLEFFFYTDEQSKANDLLAAVKNLNYSAETGLSAGDDNLYIITGWTTKIKMSTKEVLNWTKSMCELGYKHDCEFDGWGTNPEQP